MAIAILAMLGIEAGVILALILVLLVVKRVMTIRHPAVFKARVRLSDGQFPGVTTAWKKCYGAWVTTVFTTRKGLPLNIADVLPVAQLDDLREAALGDDVKGLGDRPTIASFTMTSGAKLEVAMAADERPAGLKPWQTQAQQLAARLRPVPESLK